MSELGNLITSCTFKGKEYMIKMNVQNNRNLEMTLTKKNSGEIWRCSFEAQEIENLTHRTGNFKSFHTFVMMLKSGLLKTSDSVNLDLLSLNDLEFMRNRRLLNQPSWSHLHNLDNNNNNINNNNKQNKDQRKFLILTYTVEFDRIHYPLTLEYCGLPSAKILQNTIKRLENDVTRLNEQLMRVESRSNEQNNQKIKQLEKQVKDLQIKNENLRERLKNAESMRIKKHSNMERQQMHHSCVSRCNHLSETMEVLEQLVHNERLTFNRIIKKLKDENRQLNQHVKELRSSESVMAARIRHQQELFHQEKQRPNDRSRCSSHERNLKVNKIINKWQQDSDSDSSNLQKSNLSETKRRHLYKSKFLKNNSHLSKDYHNDNDDGGGGDDIKRPSSKNKIKNKRSNSKDTRSSLLSSSSSSSLSYQNRHLSSSSTQRSDGRHSQHNIHRQTRSHSSDSKGSSIKYKKNQQKQDKKLLLKDLETRIETLQRLIQQGINI